MRRDDALKILGFSKNDPTDKEIRKTFLKLSLTKHPDKGGNPEEFHKIKQAYEILIGNEEEEDEFKNVRGFGGMDMNDMFKSAFGGFSEMFTNFQTGGMNSGPTINRKKEPIQKIIKLSVEELYKGAFRELSVQNTKQCDDCFGTGTGSRVKCSDCQGNGIRVIHQQFGPAMRIQRTTCSTCRGRRSVGEGSANVCPKCSGHCVASTVTIKKIFIPRSMPNNTRITINEGDVPTILIIQHPAINDTKWNGWELLNSRDLKYTLKITLEEALIGCSKNITQPNGNILEVIVPLGTQPNSQIKIKDKGLPSCPEAKLPPSSAIIHINVELPIIPEKHIENTKKFFELLRKSTG